jgi:hypothetical protein
MRNPYLVTAAPGRRSGDASHKGRGSSPKQAAASATTVALADAGVDLTLRFPHIRWADPEPVAPCLEDEAMQYAMEFILEPTLAAMSVSQLGTEADLVLVVTQVSLHVQHAMLHRVKLCMLHAQCGPSEPIVLLGAVFAAPWTLPGLFALHLQSPHCSAATLGWSYFCYA